MSDVIVKKGQMEKEGGGAITRWQLRMFILTRTQLTWFKPDDLRSAQGSVELSEITDVKRMLGDRQGRKNVLTVCIARKSYHLAAPNKEEQADWIAALHPNTQASFAAKVSGSQQATSPTSESEEDKVLAAVKAAAKQITGSDTDRRATVLIPIKKKEDEEEAADGHAQSGSGPGGLTSPTTPSSAGASSATKFAVVEIFISHGLRISGPVSNQMFNMLGQGISNDKKKVDRRGWFCDQSYTVCSVIQTFINSGWVLHRLSHSTSFTPWDINTLMPVNLAVFARGGGAKPLSMAKADARCFLNSAHPSGRGPAKATTPSSGAKSLAKGDSLLSSCLSPPEDAELRDLMEEFNIPLDLLDVPAITE